MKKVKTLIKSWKNKKLNKVQEAADPLLLIQPIKQYVQVKLYMYLLMEYLS